MDSNSIIHQKSNGWWICIPLSIFKILNSALFSRKNFYNPVGQQGQWSRAKRPSSSKFQKFLYLLASYMTPRIHICGIDHA